MILFESGAAGRPAANGNPAAHPVTRALPGLSRVAGSEQKEMGSSSSNSSWVGVDWTLGPSTLLPNRVHLYFEGKIGSMSMPTLKCGGEMTAIREVETAAACSAITSFMRFPMVAIWPVV